MEQYPYRAVGAALEVIPRTLAQNCGANIIRTLTKLRAKHAEPDGASFGINGITGEITDMKDLGVWEPYAVKVCWLPQGLHCLLPQCARCQAGCCPAMLLEFIVWQLVASSSWGCGRLSWETRLSAGRQAAAVLCLRRALRARHAGCAGRLCSCLEVMLCTMAGAC